MSALSDLFQSIADAIRTKTGDTGTIKPADFPSNILSIETGGGSSESSGMVVKSGYFTATAETGNLITHNLGVVPDMIYVRNDASSLVGALVVVGKSTAFKNASGGTGQHISYQNTYDKTCLYGTNVNMCIDGPHDFAISEANEKTFKFGGTKTKAAAGDEYYYEAIGGIV